MIMTSFIIAFAISSSSSIAIVIIVAVGALFLVKVSLVFFLLYL